MSSSCCNSESKPNTIGVSKRNNDSQNKFEFKIVLLGEPNVGKTSISIRYVNDKQTEDQEVTIGGAQVQKQLKVKDKDVKLHMWDTGGQERYRSMTHMYYRNANAGILVFDITKRDTFEKVDQWVRELREKEDEHMLMFLCGNKSDLDSQRTVLKDDITKYAQEKGLIQFETSAKTGESINDMFDNLGEKLVEKFQG